MEAIGKEPRIRTKLHLQDLPDSALTLDSTPAIRKEGRLLFELLLSDEFKATLDACSQVLRTRIMDTIERLRVNPGHPGLKAHRLKNAPGKWECYVSLDWRIIYDWENGTLRLWKLGDHRIVDRVHFSVFSPQTAFSRLEFIDGAEAEAAADSSSDSLVRPLPEAEADNPFAYFPAAHLRFLGVPAHLVKQVQRTPHLEDLEQIVGLPERSRNWIRADACP